MSLFIVVFMRIVHKTFADAEKMISFANNTTILIDNY